MIKIKLDSRYKDVETIYHKINNTCGFITSNGAYTRYIASKDGSSLKGIDFEGGPMITAGSNIPGINKKIKDIKICFYIELE